MAEITAATLSKEVAEAIAILEDSDEDRWRAKPYTRRRYRHINTPRVIKGIER